MRCINMPNEAKKIIDTLYNAGYEAYIVGGCVRDSLIGRTPLDYDITTSAPPAVIKEIFSKTVDTGILHGTVTVIENGKPYEVTTFRIDGEYKDNRHPVSVSYTTNVRDDLARRDFTVNALAYNDREGIIDAFSGLEDLEKKIIRCVRNPEERFSEDALRVLRGIRFSSVLGFSIEEKTADAIKKYAPNLRDVSSERIFTEWKKLLSGVNAYDVIREFKDVIEVFAAELKSGEVPPRDSFNALDWDERQIALFAKSKAQDEFSAFSKRLKMDSKTQEMGVSVLKSIYDLKDADSIGVKAFLVDKSDELSLKCAKIASALGICTSETYDRIKLLIKDDAPRKLSQLSVRGNDLTSLGIKGGKVGKYLNDLLYQVATERLANKKELLIEYVLKTEEKGCI